MISHYSFETEKILSNHKNWIKEFNLLTKNDNFESLPFFYKYSDPVFKFDNKEIFLAYQNNKLFFQINEKTSSGLIFTFQPFNTVVDKIILKEGNIDFFKSISRIILDSMIQIRPSISVFN